MGIQDESPEDYQARIRDAEEYAESKKGRKPDHNDGNRAVVVGFIAGISSLVALTIAGVIGERADWAVIAVALGAAGVNYVYRQRYTKAWYEVVRQRLLETQPKD